MTLPQQSLEVELFARQLAALLKSSEVGVLEQIRPRIQQLMAALDGLAAGAEPLSPDELYAELDRLTAPLNDRIEQLLGVAMVRLQGPLRDQASRIGAVIPAAPATAPQALLRQARVNDETIAAHLQRRSPSRWQAELMGAIRTGLEAGWERHRAAVEEGINRLTRVLVSTALWAHGNSELQANWVTPSRWRYVGVLDPSTCPVCAPWVDRTAADRSALPETPQHWSCRCHIVPA